MEDIIIRGLLADSTVKIMAISGKALVEQAALPMRGKAHYITFV